MRKSSVLIATLGGQPQVVTFALDILWQHGEVIEEVVVVHLGNQRYLRALRCLSDAFAGDQYRGRRCHFRSLPVMVKDEPVKDIQSDRHASAVWHTLYGLIQQLKEERAQVHLLLTGGRRMMSLLAVSAAMLQLEPGDHIWHLYTPRALQELARDGAILHAPADSGIRLLSVPIAMLGSYFPAIRALAELSPDDVLASQTRWLDEEDRQRCLAVWDSLTPQQQAVLRAFAEGKSRKQVAEELGISLSTVDSHKAQVLAECRVVWAVPDDTRLNYHFLERKFGACRSVLV